MDVHQLARLRMISHVLINLEQVFVESVEMEDLMRLRNVTMETMMMKTVVIPLVMLNLTLNVLTFQKSRAFVMEFAEMERSEVENTVTIVLPVLRIAQAQLLDIIVSTKSLPLV